MRTLDSEELKLVYGGGKPHGGDCKPDKKPSCSRSKPSKASKCTKSHSKSNNGNHYGWCHKKH